MSRYWFSHFTVLCICSAEITFAQLSHGQKKERTVFLFMSFCLFYRCNTLNWKSPSLHLNFVSHDFISGCGHLGSWSSLCILIKWKTITQRSWLSGRFPYRDLKTEVSSSACLSFLLLQGTTEMNYFLFSAHQTELRGTTASCSVTCIGTHGLLQWLQKSAEQNLQWKTDKSTLTHRALFQGPRSSQHSKEIWQTTYLCLISRSFVFLINQSFPSCTSNKKNKQVSVTVLLNDSSWMTISSRQLLRQRWFIWYKCEGIP